MKTQQLMTAILLSYNTGYIVNVKDKKVKNVLNCTSNNGKKIKPKKFKSSKVIYADNCAGYGAGTLLFSISGFAKGCHFGYSESDGDVSDLLVSIYRKVKLMPDGSMKLKGFRKQVFITGDDMNNVVWTVFDSNCNNASFPVVLTFNK